MKQLKTFGAGFVSTLVFHQGALALLHVSGLSARAPYAMAPTWPLHIPAVVSLALWGGLWALVLAQLIGPFRTPRVYWTTWIELGALLPSVVVFLIVLPLKGDGVAGGFSPALMATSLVLNAAWGFGVALLLRVPIPPHSFQR